MHSPSAHALRHLDRYCIVLVRTLKHVSPAKCVITITYRSTFLCCARYWYTATDMLKYTLGVGWDRELVCEREDRMGKQPSL